MNITSILIDNFRAFYNKETIDIPSGNNLLVYGENGSGKSSLFRAVHDFFNSSREEVLFEKSSFRLADDGMIQLTFSPPATRAFSITHTFHSDTRLSDTKTGSYIQQAYKAGGFLTYVQLLRTYLIEKKGENPNLFDLLVNNILAEHIIPFDNTSPLKKEWNRISKFKTMDRRWSEYKALTPAQLSLDPPIAQPEPKFTPEPPRPREKVYVNGVDVSVLISRELHFDQHGRPITTSLKDHTKEIIKEQFTSLDDFLNKWKGSDRKEAIIAELIEQGVMVEALYEAVDKQVDLFDLICHVAYDQPPLTRKERANNVKKRNYFTKYGEQARNVLEALLEKYADQGIENMENIKILTVPPISDFGSVTEIIKVFGSREAYDKAIRELENELYKAA